MTKSIAKRAAHLAARHLFTSGSGIHADRLVFVSDGRDLGGWGFVPARDVIERAILRIEGEVKPKPKAKMAKPKKGPASVKCMRDK